MHLHLKTATPYRWVHVCVCVVCHHLTQQQPLLQVGSHLSVCVCSVSSPDSNSHSLQVGTHLCVCVVCHHLTQQQPLSTGGYISVCVCVVCHHLTQQQPLSTGGYTSFYVCHGCSSLPVQLSSVQGGSSYMLRKTHALHPSQKCPLYCKRNYLTAEFC